jgi:hypothetical protein
MEFFRVEGRENKAISMTYWAKKFEIVNNPSRQSGGR